MCAVVSPDSPVRMRDARACTSTDSGLADGGDAGPDDEHAATGATAIIAAASAFSRIVMRPMYPIRNLEQNCDSFRVDLDSCNLSLFLANDTQSGHQDGIHR
jgi:hypothetical protein